MKKVLFLIYLLLLCNFLFAENYNNSISNTGVRLQIQEFVPLTMLDVRILPDMGKLVIDTPISLFVKEGILSKTDVRVWYLASSPVFFPDPFYEIGFTAELTLSQKETSCFMVGLGTSFSQENGVTSIPLITSIRWKWYPLNWLEFQPSLENLLYGEGDIIDIQLMVNFKPFSIDLLFQLGLIGSAAYSLDQNLFGYSYGLSTGLGYLF